MFRKAAAAHLHLTADLFLPSSAMLFARGYQDRCTMWQQPEESIKVCFVTSTG